MQMLLRQGGISVTCTANVPCRLFRLRNTRSAPTAAVKGHPLAAKTPKMRKLLCLSFRGFIWALAELCLLSPATSQAQSAGEGIIVGHVRGPGGVSVPGATVELVEQQTGEHKESWTDEAGNYTLSGLHPGVYKLVVSLIGFRTDVREPVPVEAAKPVKVNIALVMAVSEEGATSVARSRSPNPGGSPALQPLPEGAGAGLGGLGIGAGTAASAMGGGDGNVRFSEGAASGGAQQEDSSPGDADSSASAANSFLLSGSIAQAPAPGDDERQMHQRVEEFRRYRQSQGAPGFGGGGGLADAPFFIGNWARHRAQINRLRGNVFERYSNSALDARSYPLNVAESPRISSYQEQAGFALGGPLVIPKIYNGRDKTSFFVHYNLQRSRNPFDAFATVPTLAERNGDFSEAVIPSGPLAGTTPVIFDPASGGADRLGPRTAFIGNQIPTSRFDPAAVALLKFIPLPNLAGSVQNFHLQEALPSANDRVMGRIGHQISDKDSLNAFYFFNSSRSNSVTTFPALTSSTSVRSQNLNLGETHIFDPHLMNSFLFNFNRQRTNLLNAFAFKQNISGELGIQGVSQDPRDWGLPIISLTNFAGLNDTLPSLARNQTFRVFDFLILNKGKHNLRSGGELRRVGLNALTDPDARGTFTFSGFATSDFSAQGFPLPGTGFDFADFLLGLPQATSVRFGTSSNYFRSWVYSSFAQDDWRVNSRLTFNLGLRYEYFEPFTEKYGHLSDLAIGEGFSSVGVVTGQAPGPFPPSLIRSDKNNFAPRLGLAFRPSTKHSLVLRAGYGIFYDSSIYQRLVPNLADQPPFAQASTLLTSPRQVLTLENGFPRIAPGIVRNTYAVDPNFRTPYGQTWNFGMEDQVAPNLILSVNYVGTKGSKLDLLLGPNRAAPGSPLTTQQRLALQNALQFTYETFGASSIYEGLQVGLRQQFHGGLSMSANYTFSRSLDDAASVGGAGRTVAQNDLDLQAERGLSVFDVRHRLLINHTYEFPFGERHRYLNRGGALARLPRRSGAEIGDPLFERHRAHGRRESGAVARNDRRHQSSRRVALYRGCARTGGAAAGRGRFHRQSRRDGRLFGPGTCLSGLFLAGGSRELWLLSLSIQVAGRSMT